MEKIDYNLFHPPLVLAMMVILTGLSFIYGCISYKISAPDQQKTSALS